MTPTKREISDVRGWRDALRRAEQIVLGVRPVHVRKGILEMGPSWTTDYSGQRFGRELTRARKDAEELLGALVAMAEERRARDDGGRDNE